MLKRTLSILVLVPITLFAIWYGGIPFIFIAGGALGICAWEYARIYKNTQEYTVPAGLIVGFVIALFLARWFWDAQVAALVLVAAIFVCMIWSIFLCEKNEAKSALTFAACISGIIYIGWLGSFFAAMERLDHGPLMLTLAIFINCLNDVGAFLVGRKIGKHKMLPQVSPKKSWEGYFGGLVFCLFFSLLFWVLIPQLNAFLNLAQIIVLTLLIAVFAPIGDFGESAIKRSFGVKDSSNLIPGHGGFFDRLDSIFWAVPISFFFFDSIMKWL